MPVGGVPETINIVIDDSQLPEPMKQAFEELIRSIISMYETLAPFINRAVNYTVLRVEPALFGDTYMSNGECNVWVDEATAKLKFRVKYSDGTLKSGEVALV